MHVALAVVASEASLATTKIMCICLPVLRTPAFLPRVCMLSVQRSMKAFWLCTHLTFQQLASVMMSAHERHALISKVNGSSACDPSSKSGYCLLCRNSCVAAAVQHSDVPPSCRGHTLETLRYLLVVAWLLEVIRPCVQPMQDASHVIRPCRTPLDTGASDTESSAAFHQG